MKKMLARLIGERHEIQMSCPTDLPPILADEGGLEQILINLVVNARDAMAKGGIIHISTGFATFTEATRNAPPNARAGKFVCMMVSDSGCGMPPEVLGHLFEPFFTTKDVGKGSGLGLSTIHGIVKQHDGWIDVNSHIGQGSTFKIYLPISADPAAAHPAPKAEAPAKLANGRGETILVVEDESDVLELVCEALTQQGYNVVSAGDGPVALQIWEKEHKRIDLLLTDMIMPSGMNGKELAHKLQTSNPKLKVIYTSGYTPEFSEKDSDLIKDVNFLAKPYDLSLLLNAVRRCLDGGQLPRCEVQAA